MSAQDKRVDPTEDFRDSVDRCAKWRDDAYGKLPM